MQQEPLLQGLAAAAAGYFPRASGVLRRQPRGLETMILCYCTQGGGWCEIGGRRQPVRAGDLVVVPPHTPQILGARESDPWTLHQAEAGGTHLPEYLKRLGAQEQTVVLRIGEDVQLVHLFNEVLKSLHQAASPLQLLHASHALGHLLSVVILRRHRQYQESADGLQRVAQTIDYMNEHLHEPLRVGVLADLAGLSPAHFAVLFKQQTGSAPRDYLHLVRIHRACRMLENPALSVKEIASRLGYQDPFHFSRTFKAFQGVSPSDYRARRRTGGS